jgi:thioredoxin reductase
MAAHSALLFRQLSDDVVLFRHTAPALSDEQASQLAARGISVVEGEVVALVVEDDRVTGVRLASGEVVAREAVAVTPRLVARADLLEALGLKVAELEVGGHVVAEHLVAGSSGATEVPGVWVAGNVTDPLAQVVAAAAAGVMAAAAINADLIAEETAAAVVAAR